MKRSIKTLLIVLMLICTFSYMGVVKAASSDFLVKESSADVRTAVISLLEGKELTSSDKEVLSNFKDTYTFYYKITEIDSSKYDEFNSNDSSVSQAAAKEIANSIAVPKSTNDLSDWNTVDFNNLKITYDDLNWSSESTSPYLVALTAVETSTGSFYNYRGIYESASPSTLVAISAKQQENTDQPESDTEDSDDVEKTEDDTEDTEDSEEKSESNPETGVSDYAIYLVPLSLIAGSTLMLKRRNA